MIEKTEGTLRAGDPEWTIVIKTHEGALRAWETRHRAEGQPLESASDSGAGEYASPEKVARIKGDAHEVARDLGFPADRIDVVEGAKVSSSGIGGNVLGEYDPKSGRITVYAGSFTEAESLLPDFTTGVVAHEIMHDTFQSAVKQGYQEFNQLVAARNTKGTRENQMVQGAVSAEDAKFLDEKYPAWSLMDRLSTMPFLTRHKGSLEALRNGDGMSEYSMAWWQNANRALSTYPEMQINAVNETLAEMNRTLVTEGALVGEPVWKHFYTDLMNWRKKK